MTYLVKPKRREVQLSSAGLFVIGAYQGHCGYLLVRNAALLDELHHLPHLLALGYKRVMKSACAYRESEKGSVVQSRKMTCHPSEPFLKFRPCRPPAPVSTSYKEVRSQGVKRW
jgi:hypothetical protein